MTTKHHNSLDGVYSRAAYSACETYRYCLERKWGEEKSLCFIMLNPSTATEQQNDPTVERCERRARAGGYGSLIVLNIFAYRATDPRDMKAVFDPIGKENNKFIELTLMLSRSESTDIVCGWGTHGSFMDREKQVFEMFRKYRVVPKALDWTKHGHPKHPLYVPYKNQPHEKPYA